MCYPQQLGRSWNAFVPNPPELCLPCVPEPSRTSSAICPATLGTLSAFWSGTLRNLIGPLHRNPPECPQPSEPEPAGTASAICTGSIRDLISHLRGNRLEPHQLSASGTSSAFCTGTLQNLIRNLLRNLGLQLHQIAPKLSGLKTP